METILILAALAGSVCLGTWIQKEYFSDETEQSAEIETESYDEVQRDKKKKSYSGSGY
jgi:ABC-type maltose transport system permease subunit